MPKEVQEKSLPLNPIKRLVTVELGERGADSMFFKMATDRFRTLLTEMDAALAKTEWLSGDMYGMADVDYTPYLRRLAELGFWHLVAKDHPHVQRWYQALRSRPNFSKAIEEWETDADRKREAEDIVGARAIFEAALSA
jgi:glutathione S-transferase